MLKKEFINDNDVIKLSGLTQEVLLELWAEIVKILDSSYSLTGNEKIIEILSKKDSQMRPSWFSVYLRNPHENDPQLFVDNRNCRWYKPNQEQIKDAVNNALEKLLIV